ncbi:hypothetical protein GA0070613_0586 [Micromonospora inositola]|uniref:Uncharacterized protein n=1 Tax=Micromonospora inositola TaxID=47865 RepID=A0A1C5GYQ5_9ACTN|nr:hypothetical protein GA0070613_0586 [Micromonospora inositola]
MLAPPRWRRLVWPALTGYALVAATARPLTGAAVVAVLAPGCALLLVGVVRAPRRRPGARHLPGTVRWLPALARHRRLAGDPVTARAVITVGFAVVLALMLAVDLAARYGGVRRRLAPLSEMLIAASRTVAGRAVVLGVWLWLGWHFLAR